MGGLFDQLRDGLFGREGRAWAGSVEDLLFDGESVDRKIAVGDNEVVVTSHRLLAFTPDGDGENYRTADLPNVDDVRAGHVGEDNLVVHAVKLFLYGVVFLGVGFLFNFDEIIPLDAFDDAGEGAGQLGIGGLFGMMRQLLELIAMIDDVSRALGALFMLFGAFVVMVYLLTRERVLVVSVAGDEGNIAVPPGENAPENAVDDAVAELERVLFEPDASAAGERRSDAGADAGFKTDDPL